MRAGLNHRYRSAHTLAALTFAEGTPMTNVNKEGVDRYTCCTAPEVGAQAHPLRTHLRSLRAS